MSLKEISEAFLRDYAVKYPSRPIEPVRKKLLDYERVFKLNDKDGSGDIDLDEVVEAMKAIGSAKSKPDLKKMVVAVDDDNTGTLRFREFINLMLIEDKLLDAPIDEVEEPLAKSMSMKQRLRVRKGAVKKKKRGHLKLKIKVTKTAQGYVLDVLISKGKDLLPMDFNGQSDPFVKMYVLPDPKKDTKKKTKRVNKTLNPVWDEHFQWALPPSLNLAANKLHISLWDWDRISRNDFMGAMAFELQDVYSAPGSQVEGWFMLLDEKQGMHQNFASRVTDTNEPLAIKRTLRQAPAPGAAAAPAPKSAQKTEKPAGAMKVEDFLFVKVLGRGSFGKVFLAEVKATKELVAVKVLKKDAVIENDDVHATMTERRVLSLPGNNPFLTRMIASFQSPANLYFVMELVVGGDLMFHAMQKGKFSEAATLFYVSEICAGLWFLHERGVYYRDLKLDNVMLDHEGHVKIADFGLCKDGLSPGAVTNTFCGTPNYLAPEIIMYKDYDSSVDWWAVGVLTYEMLQGVNLFDGDTEEELFEHILTQEIEVPRTVSAGARTFIRELLNRDPRARLGSGPDGKLNIQSHAFFAGLSWDDVFERKCKPPLVPKIKDPREAANFDPEFTREKPVVSPTDAKTISGIDQNLFEGFSFVNKTELK